MKSTVRYNHGSPGLQSTIELLTALVLGPIIRINPREVHISDLSFLDEIYSTLRPRNKDEQAVSGLDVGLSLGGTCPHELHKRRREALTPFFSKKGVLKLESFVSSKVKQLCQQFEDCRQRGVPVNLGDAYFAFSQDIVKQYGFGHDEDLLGDLDRAATAHGNLNSFMMNTHITMHFGWTIIPLLVLPQKAIKVLAPAVDDFMQFQKVRPALSSTCNFYRIILAH